THARAGGWPHRPRRARARSLARSVLSQLLPHHDRRGGTHRAGRPRAGGTVRKGIIARETAETTIRVTINLDGRGRFENRTGIRFLDHMLDLVARHGGFDLAVIATGDLDVDQHHTVEDVGIALGEAVAKAIGNKRGINRAGYFVMPMDETLAVVAIDLSGRPACVVDLKKPAARVGDLTTELVADFFD